MTYKMQMSMYAVLDYTFHHTFHRPFTWLTRSNNKFWLMVKEEMQGKNSTNYKIQL